MACFSTTDEDGPVGSTASGLTWIDNYLNWQSSHPSSIAHSFTAPDGMNVDCYIASQQPALWLPSGGYAPLAIPAFQSTSPLAQQMATTTFTGTPDAQGRTLQLPARYRSGPTLQRGGLFAVSHCRCVHHEIARRSGRRSRRTRASRWWWVASNWQQSILSCRLFHPTPGLHVAAGELGRWFHFSSYRLGSHGRWYAANVAGAFADAGLDHWSGDNERVNDRRYRIANARDRVERRPGTLWSNDSAKRGETFHVHDASGLFRFRRFGRGDVQRL